MSDSQQCPTCDREFDSESAMKIHHKRAHDESIAYSETRACVECDGTFTITSKQPDKKFCSLSCKNEGHKNRVELTCAQCGDSFEVRECRADGREFCSKACGNRNRGCFIPKRNCAGCGIKFQPPRDRPEQEYCMPACRYEAARSDATRPEVLDELLVEQYDERDQNLKQTFKRAKTAVRDGSYERDDITKDETRERLKDLGVFTHHKSFNKLAEELNPDDVGLDGNDGTRESDVSWRESYSEEEASADD